MRRTRPGTLVATAVVAGTVGWSAGRLVDALGGVQPRGSWLTPALLAVLAVLLALASRAVRGWVRERRYDRWLNALGVARLLVVAKAAAVLGAVVAGGYAGLAIPALALTAAPAGRERVYLGGGTALTGLAVAVAGLLLERACMVPPDEDSAQDRHDGHDGHDEHGAGPSAG